MKKQSSSQNVTNPPNDPSSPTPPTATFEREETVELPVNSKRKKGAAFGAAPLLGNLPSKSKS